MKKSKKIVKKMKKKKNEFLFIGVKEEPLLRIVERYCKEIGFDFKEVIYATGTLESNNPEARIKMNVLGDLYFFAGIFYAKTHEVQFEYREKKEKKESPDLSYMG